MSLTLIGQIFFPLLCLVSIIDFLKHRDIARRDIALMFTALGVAIFVLPFTRLLDLKVPWLRAVGTIALIAQPYLMLSVVCSVRDISAHKNIEKELQGLNQLKTEFLSTAAHELRTPLTSIRGFSEILLTRELDTERQRRYVRLINEQGTQLGQLIDDLLDISRLEAKRGLSLHLENLDMGELLTNVCTPFVESAPNHFISIEGPEDCCPPLVGDSFRLAQVIKNLLSNAVKYSPEGGTITVRYHALADDIAISVRDQGIGLTPAQQTHLFEKFYRADASNTAVGGTGLGLAICKVIVELHGGRIWCESEYGVGSTFYFTLPLARQQAVVPGLAGAKP